MASPYLFTEGEKVNPLDGAVLADSGALSAGDWSVEIYASTGVAARIQLQHRNDANNQTLFQHAFAFGATTVPWHTKMKISAAEGERVRVVLDGLVIGRVQVTLDVR